MKKTLLLLTLVYFLCSCASSYKVINPNMILYKSNSNYKNVEFSYKYDVLMEKGNKKYAKKESTKGIKVVAVKITNNSNSSFTFGKDLLVYSGDNPLTLLEPEMVHKQLKQRTPLYLLYLLLTPLQIYTSDESYPIGLILGPGIAGGNMIMAGSANKNFKAELSENLLNNRSIPAGDTVYGLIGIVDSGYNTLTLRE